MIVRKIAQPQVEFPSKTIPFDFRPGNSIAACKK
jgi:hypothetical protein